MSGPNVTRTVDLDEVGDLVDQLERDLAKARAGGASVDTLRAEVEQLRVALSAAEPSHDEVKVGLHGVGTKLDELGDDLKSRCAYRLGTIWRASVGCSDWVDDETVAQVAVIKNGRDAAALTRTLQRS